MSSQYPLHAVQLIGNHLKKMPSLQRDIPLETGISAVCAISGAPISEGVPLKKVLSSTFTDYEYIKYPSQYLSLEAFLCISEIFPSNTPNRYNSLRVYNYYANQEKFQILKREEILPLLIHPPQPPFILCTTYNNKKHTSYKARVNWDTEEFIVRTDLGHVLCPRALILQVIPILEKWYKIIPGSTGNSPHTFFTKQEILTGNLTFKNVERYGEEAAFEENEFLQNFRGSAWFELVVHVLIKK